MPHRTLVSPISDPGWDPLPTISPSHNCGEAKLCPALDFSVNCSPAPITSHKNIISHPGLSAPPRLHSRSILECEHGYRPNSGPSLLFRTHVTFSAAWNYTGLGQGSVNLPPIIQRQPGMASSQNISHWDLMIRHIRERQPNI